MCINDPATLPEVERSWMHEPPPRPLFKRSTAHLGSCKCDLAAMGQAAPRRLGHTLGANSGADRWHRFGWRPASQCCPPAQCPRAIGICACRPRVPLCAVCRRQIFQSQSGSSLRPDHHLGNTALGGRLCRLLSLQMFDVRSGLPCHGAGIPLYFLGMES
jgi:hypothetical protein